MKIFLLSLALTFLMVGSCFSDVFILVNGNTIEGSIVKEVNNAYIVAPAIDGVYVGGTLKLEKIEVASVVKTVNIDYLPNQITLAEKRRLEEKAVERNERYYRQAEMELWFYRFLKYKVSVGDLISSYYLFDFLNR